MGPNRRAQERERAAARAAGDAPQVSSSSSMSPPMVSDTSVSSSSSCSMIGPSASSSLALAQDCLSLANDANDGIKRRAAGEKLASIAKSYGVSHQTIGRL